MRLIAGAYKPPLPAKRPIIPGHRVTLIAVFMVGLLTGCSDKAVYTPSIAGLNQKAMGMLQAGQVDEAISRLESAQDLNPDEPNTMFNLAMAYHAKGLYEKETALLESLEKNPRGLKVATIHQALGEAYEAQGDNAPQGQRVSHYQQALQEYRQIEPKTPDIQAHLEQIEKAAQPQ